MSVTLQPLPTKPVPASWTPLSLSPCQGPTSSSSGSYSPTCELRELADAKFNSEIISQKGKDVIPFPALTTPSPSPPSPPPVPRGRTRRYYSSPLSDECQYTPVEVYGLEQPEQHTNGQRANKRRSRLSALVLDDIKEDSPLQLDQQKTFRRGSSASIMKPPPPSRSSTMTSLMNISNNNNNNNNNNNDAGDGGRQYNRRPSLGRKLSTLSIGSRGKSFSFRPFTQQHSASVSQPNLLRAF